MASDLPRRNFLKLAGTAVAAGAVAQTTLAQEPSNGAKAGPVKIVGVCCSLRAGKSTVASVGACLEAAKAAAPDRIAIELIDLADLKIPAGPAAGLPLEPGQQDVFPALVPKLADPQVAGIIIGTPVYFGNMSSLCKAFLERCMAFRKDGFALGNKVGAVLAVGGSRNGGQEQAIKSVQTVLSAQNMLIVGEAKPLCHCGATVWNNGDAFLQDEGNQATIKSVGQRVAEVALMIAAQWCVSH
jgi:multimeric flavodoxin WrbA